MVINRTLISLICVFLFLSITSTESRSDSDNSQRTITLLDNNNPENIALVISAMLQEAKRRNNCTQRVAGDPIFDPDDIIHYGEIWLRVFVKYGDEAIAILREASSDENICVRGMVAEILSLHKSPEALPLLIEMLDDSDPRVRNLSIGGIGSLAYIKDWNVDYPIIKIMEISKEDKNPEVRERAITTLIYLQQSIYARISGACVDGLSDDSDYVKAVSSLCVGRLEADGAHNYLKTSILENPDVSVNVKRYAYYAFGRMLYTKRDVEILLNGLKSEDIIIKSEVASIIAEKKVRTSIRNILWPDVEDEFIEYIVSLLKESIKNETEYSRRSGIQNVINNLEAETKK